MQFVDRNVTVVFITKCLFKHRPDTAACKNMVQLFYVCLRYNGITSIARRWMLLCFGRGYNNQVTVAFGSSDVTKHVVMTCTVLLSGKIVLTFLRSTVVR